MAMRSLVMVLAVFSLGVLASSPCEAQTTYTWTGNFNQEWQSPGNWLPPRTDPASRDILQFGESATVTKVPTEVIGKLELLNSANVTLQAEHAGNELTIATPVMPVTGLHVHSGCTLTTGSPGLKLTLDTNVSALIDGTLALGDAFTNTVTTTVNGTLQFNLGGSWSGNPPDYDDNSTLKYSSTGTFLRGDEWSATSGAGYPANVRISNSTTLDLAGMSGAATTRQMSGDLTVDSGSKLGMNEHEMTGNLIVSGDVTVAGTLELGMGSLTSETGSIEVGGDWTISPGGTFLIGPSSRYDARVTFNGSGTQLISATGELNFPSIFIDKTSGNVELACDARLNAWIATALGMEHGDLDLAGNKLSVSRGEAWFVVSNEEHWILGPGTVYFDVGGPGTHGNGSLVFDEGVTVTCCGGIAAMDAPVTINGVLESRCGGLVAGSVPLYYGPHSLLLYRIDDFFNRGAGMEWSVATGPGAPMDVQITVTPGHTGTLGLNSWSWQTNTVPHGVRGDFTIDPGCKFIIGSGLPVSVQGDVTVLGELDLYNLPVNGGLEVGRHWTLDDDGTFVPNGVEVVFNGSQQSSVIGATTFDRLTVDNAAGVLLNNDINVNQGLTLTSGDLKLNGHTMSKVSGAVVDVVVSGGARTILGPGTVFWEGMSLAGSGSLVIPEGVLLSCGGSASITAPVAINGVLESRNGPVWSGTGPAPITYGANSILRYKVDGISRGAGMEWSYATGPGAPVRVDVTTTPMHSGTLSLIEWPWQADVTPHGVRGNFMVGPGSTFSQNSNLPLAVQGNVSVVGAMGFSGGVGGNLELAGNWSLSGTFNPDDHLVTFNGSAPQTITGLTTFDHLAVDNAAGVQLNNDINVNQGLTLTNGDLDLNGHTMSKVSGAVVDVVVSGGARTILGPGTVFWESMSLAGSGSLVIPEGVLLSCGGSASIAAPVAINGVLESRGGPLCSGPGAPPIAYGANSLLRYKVDGIDRGAGAEWGGTGSGAPVTAEITATPGQTGTLGLIDTPDQATDAHLVRGDLTVGSGCTFSQNSDVPLAVQGNVSVVGAMGFSGGTGGNLELAGNWSLSGTFSPDDHVVTFNGSVQQTITGLTTFAHLAVDNAAGVQLNNDINVNQGLTLTNGDLDLNGHTMSKVSGAVVDVVVSGGARTILGPGTVFWEGMSLAGSGSLVIPEGVLLSCGGSASITAPVAINGVLESRNGPIWSGTGPVPIAYGANSLLRYKVDGIDRGAGAEWGGTGSGAPVTAEITATSGQTGTLGLIDTPDQATDAHLVRGDLTVGSGSTFNQNSDVPLAVQGNVSVVGAMGFSGGVGGNLELAGNWSLSGTFNPDDHLVTFNGSAPQTITGLTTFDHLAVDNAAGVILDDADVTVDQTLTFTSGTISTGAKKVVVGPEGSISRTSGHVVGNLQMPVETGLGTSMTFVIGDASGYAPVVAALDTVTTAGNLMASTTGGDHPELASSTIGSTFSVNRFWTLTSDGVVFGHCDATFNFQPGDLDPGADTDSFIVGRRDSTWSYPTVGAMESTSTQAVGLTVFGDFVLGENPPSPVCFEEAQTFETGLASVSVAIGDLSGDGNPDLAVANDNGSTVSVLLGNGDGTFGAKIDYQTYYNAQSVAIGDLNDDGKPDLAVECYSSRVSVLLGNGDGTFGAHTDFVTSGGDGSVAIGDLNSDGNLDLAVACNWSSCVSVLLGVGDGTFEAKTDFRTAHGPLFVVVGDLNGDRRLDLATASDSVSVLLGKGDGTFWDKTDYEVGGRPMSVAIGDLNGDGTPDLAMPNFDWDVVSVLSGNGDGTFGAKTDFETGSRPSSVAIEDLNDDGNPDLAVANRWGGTVTVLLGNGNGGFGTRTDLGAGSAAISVAVGDLNRDGKPDLAAVDGLYSPVNGSVSVLLNIGACPHPTGVAEPPLPTLPQSFQFLAPWPNPTHGASEIRFLLPAACTVDVALYNVAGRKVRSLASGELTTPGEHTIRWDGRDSSGALVGSGVYFVKVRAGGDEGVRKLVILR
jgi:hypothetical protein